MSKNVVVCFDGTANQFTRNRTNVVKLFFTLAKNSPKQACYYHPGVGTMAPAGFATPIGTKLAQIAGMTFGYGISNDIRDAYIFIANTFDEGDRLFLFGFSRGAYTVRAVASMLQLYGVIERGNEPLAPYMVRMLWAIHSLDKHSKADAPPDPRRAHQYFELAEAFKQTFSSECKPHFVGLWDTVSSIGWFTSPVSLPYTANNPDIQIGRHAVSIDEHRAFFRSNLWHPSNTPGRAGPRDLQQVWFPGVHSDVGGGYPENESSLSKIALGWMIDEARLHGLLLDEAKVDLMLGRAGPGYAGMDPNGCLHDSLTGWWKLAEYVPKARWNAVTKQWERRANHFKRRELPPRACVHDAAWERSGGYADRLPADAIRLSEAKWEALAAPA